VDTIDTFCFAAGENLSVRLIEPGIMVLDLSEFSNRKSGNDLLSVSVTPIEYVFLGNTEFNDIGGLCRSYRDKHISFYDLTILSKRHSVFEAVWFSAECHNINVVPPTWRKPLQPAVAGTTSEDTFVVPDDARRRPRRRLLNPIYRTRLVKNGVRSSSLAPRDPHHNSFTVSSETIHAILSNSAERYPTDFQDAIRSAQDALEETDVAADEPIGTVSVKYFSQIIHTANDL
jgi:hypothetical protein